jgi:hypothetical protein
MQNFFLSTALGRAADGAGNQAKKQLIENIIPSARAADIQIIWLNVRACFCFFSPSPSPLLQAQISRRRRKEILIS